MVRYRMGHEVAASVGESPCRSVLCYLYFVHDATRDAAWEVFIRFDDRRLSFADCTSFAMMHAMGLAQVFTSTAPISPPPVSSRSPENGRIGKLEPIAV